ncbi:MAG TPA: BamA/TamA family outer membrane protein [Vicinamibacteria bacterium]|jgi:Tol biopolymer transport system component
MTSRRATGAAMLAALILVVAEPARAQYFGRNAVQWEDLKFEVLATPHFDIHYYPQEKEAAEQVGRMAERWYARLSAILDFRMKDRQPLILYASHPHFQQTNTVGGPPGEGTGGVTEAFKRRIVLPVGASLAETDHVVGHELVHAFQFAMTGQGKVSATNFPSALRMPLWFIEGMAEYLSVGPLDPHTAMWIRDAARQEKGLPTIRQLGSAKYFPYRYGQAFWAWLAGQYGDEVMGRALRALGPRDNDAEAILKAITEKDEKTLTKEWHAAVREAVAPVMTGRKDPDHYGTALVTEEKQGGRLNVGPALSPDGTRVAFLSERELFAVEVFVADARTGDVERRLSHAAVDPHLDSLQFINSAGAWDPAGQRFALGAVAKGRAALVIMDTRNGGKEREVPFPGLGELYTPSFSPDGRKVVFSALAGGFTDLYAYDLEAGTLRRLTTDTFADLQPAWSPDGRQVAFVTDRFSTRLDTLDPGNYRLAALDVASGEVRALPGFDKGKNINPQWSRDGSSIYFLANRDGVTNVHRLELASGTLYQLTDLVTGASGITALSPALSVATRADRLAYSVYGDGRHEIFTIEGAEKMAGWQAAREPSLYAGVIPAAKPQGAVVQARADATTGLTDPEAFQEKPYKAKLSLDYIGQPYLTAGVGRYGAFFGGGVSMIFSDMLGNHTLSTAIQADNVSGFTDIGALVSYVNREHRLNWGVQGYQIPYITGRFANGVTTVNGQQMYVEETLIERETQRGLMVMAFRPFDAALRLEASAGYRNIGYDSRLETLGFSLRTGQQILEESVDLPSPDPVHLFEGSLALVRDSSVFGATSPILGQRFRLDVTPVMGTVNYTGALADFRQYVMPVRPVTLAGRVLHYGRYGSGGEDPRLSSLFLGYPNLVRGYDTGSFSASECGPQNDTSCPVYDQLLGSRLLVGNVELRAPLLGLFGARNLYGPIPVEIAAFFDAGVAWDSASRPRLFGGEREIVKSTGATARVNMFGFAVLQVDWVKPLDRAGKSPYWTFNLLAGF